MRIFVTGAVVLSVQLLFRNLSTRGTAWMDRAARIVDRYLV